MDTEPLNLTEGPAVEQKINYVAGFSLLRYFRALSMVPHNKLDRADSVCHSKVITLVIWHLVVT